jgi:uncharacterized protein involved in type VI secretion and phage assembly
MSIHEALGVDDQNCSGINGVAAGIVIDNEDIKKLGRVKLKFPWLSDDNESNWARVATLMSGAERGSFFLPEVGDEVLVAFDHGNIDCPYVIGMLWNSAAVPPQDNGDGENNIRTFKSRSGHQLTFDDTADKTKLELVSGGLHTILLDDASSGPIVEITSAGGNSIKMDDNAKTITIESGGNSILIDATANAVSIESAVQLSIKATSIEIEGSASLALKSSGPVTIEGMPIMIN